MVVVYAIVVVFLWIFVRRRISKKPTGFVHPDWSKNGFIYEVNIRQYTPEGTFKAFQQHLPRLNKMGVEILWLMPVTPIGEKNRKGTLGSYYSVKDFLAINPEFGTLDDFKDLVEEAHEMGMKVIIDWVANHTSWDCNLVTEHPEWYQHDEQGNIKSPVADWTDAAGLDYSLPEVCEYMTDALLWWIKETDIDGYRCDVAGMVPVSFWNEAVPQLRKIKKVFMLAEWETPEMHDIAFDATYSFDFYHLMNDIATGKKNATEIDSLWENENENYPADAFRLRYTSNHDENSWNGSEYERLGDAAKTFAVLSFCIPGMPLVYSGQESSFNRRLKFFDKDQIDWDGFNLQDFYTTLIQLKKENPALWNGAAGGLMTKVTTTDDNHIYAFTRIRGNSRIFAIFNLSADKKDVKFVTRNFIGIYKNVFTEEIVSLTAESSFSMKPWEYMVLEKK